MTTWINPEAVDVPDNFRSIVGGHPVIADTLFRRGIRNPEEALSFLNPDLYKPSPSHDIPGMEKAVIRLMKAKEKGDVVCVWGDFDVDGQTSTALLVSALRRINISTIYHVPLRDRESHGVNIPLLKLIIGESNQPKINLLLTCDTGIASNEAINFANQSGVDVIITDHHDLPENIPGAEAVLNPKMLPGGHALYNLPGVGVAFKLIEGLYNQLGLIDDTDSFLDLVALGIVSDVVPLTKDNRYLLQLGIEKLRSAERPGLSALYDFIDLNPKMISEEHIGFMIAPRLNAIGRLDNAEKGVELLLTQNQDRARILSLELETCNTRRKLLTNQVYSAAISEIEKYPELLENSVLVISNPTWPAGIIGIVASKLVEKFHKPVILISTNNDEIGKGSARSVNGIDISAAIRESSRYLLGYGGHPMAAGLKIDPIHIGEFRKSISSYVNALDVQDIKEANFDSVLNLGEINLEFVEDVERLAPFGNGNPPLVFMSEDLKFKGFSTVGREDEHISVTVSDKEQKIHKFIWWNGAENFNNDISESSELNLLYTARSTSFRGEKSIQLEWIDCQVMEKDISAIMPSAIRKIYDYRNITKPYKKLNNLEIGEETQIWVEAGGASEIKRIGIEKNVEKAIADRYSIGPVSKLVIWTTPPGRWELKQVIDRASPEEISFFCVNPGSLELNIFLKKLIGMVKYGIKTYKGFLDVEKIAVALGQREITILKGLDWMVEMGYLRSEIEGHYQFASEREQVNTNKSQVLQNQINFLLEETNAYRKYLNRIEFDILKSGI